MQGQLFDTTRHRIELIDIRAPTPFHHRATTEPGVVIPPVSRIPALVQRLLEKGVQAVRGRLVIRWWWLLDAAARRWIRPCWSLFVTVSLLRGCVGGPLEKDIKSLQLALLTPVLFLACSFQTLFGLLWRRDGVAGAQSRYDEAGDEECD